MVRAGSGAEKATGSAGRFIFCITTRGAGETIAAPADGGLGNAVVGAGVGGAIGVEVIVADADVVRETVLVDEFATVPSPLKFRFARSLRRYSSSETRGMPIHSNTRCSTGRAGSVGSVMTSRGAGGGRCASCSLRETYFMRRTPSSL